MELYILIAEILNSLNFQLHFTDSLMLSFNH